ncbi:hypothetical protein YPPY48_2222, partial [Yersinia pestis PY-48]
MAIVFNKILS